jgi:hypothetical protein
VEGGLVTIRLVGHFPPEFPPPQDQALRRQWLPPYYRLMMVFIAVEFEAQASVDTFAPSNRLSRLRTWLAATFAVPTAIVAFASEETDTGLFASLWTHDPGVVEPGAAVDPYGYADRLNRRRNPLVGDDPTQVKPINKTLNDMFQRWTRAYLTGQLSINDLDAIVRFDDPTRVFVLEVKRSNVPNWTPYLNDVPNYLLMKAAARQGNNVGDLTVKYSTRSARSVELHTISSVAWDRIPGWKRVLTGDDAAVTVTALVTHLHGLADSVYSSTSRLA